MPCRCNFRGNEILETDISQHCTEKNYELITINDFQFFIIEEIYSKCRLNVLKFNLLLANNLIILLNINILNKLNFIIFCTILSNILYFNNKYK